VCASIFNRPHSRASRYWTFDIRDAGWKKRAEVAEVNGRKLKGREEEEEEGKSSASKWLE
jgi:hypothetical protein